MTHRERVIAALNHKEPDSVPTGEFATDFPIVEQVLGRQTFWRGKAKMIKALWSGRRDEVVESQKVDLVDFTLKLGLDMAPVNLVINKRAEFEVPEQIDEDTWEDFRGSILKYSYETHDIGLVKFGNKPAPPRSLAPLPPEPDESELELVRYVMERLGKTHFIFARPGRAGIGYPTGLGLEEQYIRLADDPEGEAKRQIAGAERMAEAIKPFVEAGVDAIAIGNDYGFNSGPFMSPRQFYEIFFPAMKRQCEIIHKAGKYVLFHSCGNNRQILDMMVEAGMDCYQSIQPIEKIDEIKALYGDRLTLWGGVSSGSLCQATPEEIRRQVLFSLKYCASGGGFILGSSHSLMTGCKKENYLMMLEALRQFGRYPIGISEEVVEPNWGPA